MTRPAVKVLQYNVLFAKDSQPTPWEQRAAALRAWIKHLDPDIITMQEIMPLTALQMPHHYLLRQLWQFAPRWTSLPKYR